jgi:hypothetical protein
MGLLVIAAFDQSWLGRAALIAAPTALCGWFIFLWRGGYHMDARERE